jgi:hypothetical protein
MDVFQGLASFVLGRLKESAYSLWFRLIFSLIFSATVTGTFVTGAVTLKTGSLVIGFASGLMSSSLIMLAVFQGSKLSKGLTIAVPKEIIDTENNEAIQTITKK